MIRIIYNSDMITLLIQLHNNNPYTIMTIMITIFIIINSIISSHLYDDKLNINLYLEFTILNITIHLRECSDKPDS